MKSEHRHELQTNTLASFMANLPQTLQKHSSKILTFAAIVLLVVAVFNYRSRQREYTRLEVQDAMGKAWQSLGELRSGSNLAPVQIEAQIRTSVQKVLDDADPKADRGLLASAWLVTGDMYWTLAINARDAAPLTQSTTQPTTQATPSREAHLKSAAEAYQKIVDNYSDQAQALSAARFSLAAIAENLRDWNTAREQYKLLIESPGTTAADKVMAENRIAVLSDLEKPLLLLPATRPVAGESEEIDEMSELMNSGFIGQPEIPLDAGPIGPVGPSTQPSPSTQPATP